MNISVYGNSFEAHVLASGLADFGNRVCLVENGDEFFGLNKKYDREYNFTLRHLTDKVLASEQLVLGTLSQGAQHSNIHFIVRVNNTESLFEIIEKICYSNKQKNIFVISASIPLYEIDNLKQKLTKLNKTGHICSLVSFPLFIREDYGLNDLYTPSLFLLGSDEEESFKVMRNVLSSFSNKAKKTMYVDFRTSELIKSAISNMLGLRVSFMNELAGIADNLKVDIELVREGVASDPRVGEDYLYPGCGFGGATLPKELDALKKTFQFYNRQTGLIDTAIKINELQKESLFRKLWRYYGANLKGKTVAVWGGAFKPETSSVTNSPVHSIIQALHAQGVIIKLYDPKAGNQLKNMYSNKANFYVEESPYKALDSADALMIVTNWNEFYSPFFDKMLELMRAPVIFDGRNLYDPDEIQTLGFKYFGIGRGERV